MKSDRQGRGILSRILGMAFARSLTVQPFIMDNPPGPVSADKV